MTRHRRGQRSSGVEAKLTALSRPSPRFESGLEHANPQPLRKDRRFGRKRVRFPPGPFGAWEAPRVGVSGCYPDCGRFESFPKRSEPPSSLILTLPESPLARDASLSSWRPGVQFPPGALGIDTASAMRDRPRSVWIPLPWSPTVSIPFTVWPSRRSVPSACQARAHSPHRSVSFPATPRRGDRRVEAFLRQDFAGSNPVGGSSIENIPDKGSTRVLPTPDPALTVFRSPPLITWPMS